MASDKSRKRVAKKYGDMPDKWDDWHVRLPAPKDQIRVIDLYHKSGSMSKSEFVRARLLGEHFKVITVDKSAVEYYRKLTEITAEVHKIGVNYNQVVRFFHITERETTTQTLLQELIRLTKELTALQEKAVSLTI
uniref:plasmid mobilization protein n=1 Tax=Prevotella intermedia TaxID=28131 RepID=UPI00077DF288